jgi:hypothetical protein
MQMVRTTVLAILAALALFGATASVADASPQPRAAVAADRGVASNIEPSDPGIPPPE